MIRKLNKEIAKILVCLLLLTMLLPGSVNAQAQVNEALIEADKEEQETVVIEDHPVYTRIDLAREHIDQYESYGELGNPVVKQLSNRLDQALHQIEKGAFDQAEKKIQDFLKHLINNGMQEFISDEAKAQLTADANAIIEALDPDFVANLVIVSEGQAKAVVILPSDASERIQNAADTLVEYVNKSTGVTLPILASDGEIADDVIPIYVGMAAPGEETLLEELLDSMIEDGYVIHPTNDTITIIGPIELGTEYGVYEFLERYVGVRWLMPGEVGEDVPQLSDIKVLHQDVIEEPVYLSRNMYPLHFENQGIRYEWGVKNRIRNQNNGWTHNVYNMFPVAQYLEDHPEWYPHPDGLDGEPNIPSPYHRWQPAYSNEETVQVAVDYILSYFERNPDEPSMSLAVNDSGNYCEQYPWHEYYTGERNSLGLHNMSEIYYAWVNKVVEKVLEVYPDKWFGVLAYQEVYDPPSFPLNERVVPYITKDRMSWIDPVVREEDQTIMEAWSKKASYIGYYDYIYSNPYVLPRVYNNLLGDVLEYGADNNVVAFFGEAGPNWGDGPKSWLLSKLMWDPYQDVEDLENEWYERAVGSEAAPYLKAYFDHWHDFWENRIEDTSWFQSRKRIVYFDMTSADYLNIVSDEEIRQSRVWLEAAVASASTGKQKARAEIILKQFEYYEASALSYPKKVDAPTNAEDALLLLEESVNYQSKLDYAKKRFEILDSFEEDPILRHGSKLSTSWSGLNPDAFWKIVNYVKQYEEVEGPVRDRLVELAENGEAEDVRNYAQLMLRAVENEPINLNSSFEDPDTTGNELVTAEHWDANITRYGTFQRKEEKPYSGDASIYLHEFWSGNINQTVDVKPGLIIAQLKYYVTTVVTELLGTVWLDLEYLDKDGNVLSSIRTAQQPFVNSLGRWETIGIMDQVPARVDGEPVTQVRMSATINGFQEGGIMYLDDFELYQADNAFNVPFIKSAVAENGILDIEFNKILDHDPVAEDFEIWQLSGEEPVQVLPEVTWDAEKMIASLSLPEVPLQPWSQSVEYQVNYGNVDEVTSKPVSIPALPGYTQLLTNNSFENWTGNFPNNWKFLAEAFKRTNDISYSGNSSIVANGLSPQEIAASGSGPGQTVDIEPGKYIGVYRFMTESEADGALHFLVQTLDSNGNIIWSENFSSERIETKISKGRWTTVTFEFEIDNPNIHGLSLYVLLRDMPRKSGNMLYIDDIELIKVAPLIESAELADNQVKVKFNRIPVSVPVSTDFEVVQHNEEEPVSMSPDITWDAENLIATFSVTEVDKKPWGQKIHYDITYNGEHKVKTNAVDVLPLEGYTQLLTNNSFETCTDKFPDNWGYLAEAFKWTNSVSRSGQSSLVANGLSPQEIAASGSGPRQTVDLTAGKYIGVYRFMTESQADGELHYFIQIRDVNGTLMYPSIYSERIETKVSNGKWRTVSFEFELKDENYPRPIGGINLYVLLRDMPRASGNMLYLDDMELYPVDE